MRDSVLRPLARWSLRCAAVIAVLLGGVTAARAVVGDQYVVPTASMWPTIAPGDYIFVSKAAYGVRLPLFADRWLYCARGPSVGDIIVFTDPRGGKVPLVKRVVALGGHEVALRHSVLILDGRPQRLEVLAGGRVVEHLGAVTHAAGEPDPEDYGPAVVPSGHVFVMGDNRGISLDSRALGPISVDSIRGRVLGAVVRYDGSGFDGSGTGALRSID